MGKRSKSCTEKSKKKKSDDQTICSGIYVLLKCEKYKDFLPQIGHIAEIDDSSVTIEWLEGSFSGTWSYWKHRGKVITETFPKRAIIKRIELTASMRLKKTDVQDVKQLYETAEFV